MDIDDKTQILEEDAARDIVAVQRQLDRIQDTLPALIDAHSNAKRDLDIANAQIRHLRERIRGRQSVMKSLRPY